MLVRALADFCATDPFFTIRRFFAILLWLSAEDIHPFTIISQIMIFNVMSFVKAALILLFTRHFLLNLLYRKAKILAQRVNDFLQISQLFERFITLIIVQRNFVRLLVNLAEQLAAKLLFV